LILIEYTSFVTENKGKGSMTELKKIMNRIFPFLAILWTLLISSNGISQNNPWKKVDEGLFWAEFYSSSRSSATDSKIIIVKSDPKFYSYKLLCASDLGRMRLTAKDWCLKHNLISAINAGMYQEDGLRSVGYMKNFSHVNNPRLNNTFKAVLAFNRTDVSVPEIQIIDLKCQAFEELKPKYQTFVQSIRMISCQQDNVWTKQDRMSSLAVLGTDKNGDVLFIFSDASYSGYDFINVLLSLPISIYNAMYLEGGSDASFYFSLNGMELDKVGMNGSGLNGDLVRSVTRAIPNVIGITKKTK
jgi:uncharacterized protein YigE (DUF2233 family)